MTDNSGPHARQVGADLGVQEVACTQYSPRRQLKEHTLLRLQATSPSRFGLNVLRSRQQHRARRVSKAVLAILALTVTSACGDASREAHLVNECEYALTFVLTSVSADMVDAGYSEVAVRAMTPEKLEPGKVYVAGLSPDGPGVIRAVIIGEDRTRAVYWGEDLTGSLDFTVEGEDCLVPADE